MPRGHHGKPRWNDARGCWVLRVSFRDPNANDGRRRETFEIPDVTKDEVEKAHLVAKLMIAKLRGRSASEGELARDYAQRYFAFREEQGYVVRHDRAAWKHWFESVIGDTPIARVSRDQIEDIRDALDTAVMLRKRKGDAEGLSGKRAMNIWTALVGMFKASVGSKRRDLRVRADNPCDGVAPPERTAARRKTFVYPNEFRLLMMCDEVPLEWREVYAIACFLYLRPGELVALTWGDVELETRIVYVTKAWDEDTRTLGETKTEEGVREVPIEPELVPLLERMRAGKKSTDLVLPILSALNEDVRAQMTRTHLLLAGADRARLHTTTATTMMVNFRSWRDTGITWLALAGTPIERIQRRAGHKSISTTIGYVKMAEDLAGRVGVPFPTLPATLTTGSQRDDTGSDPPKTRRILCEGGDLNPHASRR